MRARGRCVAPWVLKMEGIRVAACGEYPTTRQGGHGPRWGVGVGGTRGRNKADTVQEETQKLQPKMGDGRLGPHGFHVTATTGTAVPSVSAAWLVHSLNGLGTKSSFFRGAAQREGPQTANGLLISLIVMASQPVNGSKR